jgi:signal transduction histidine kinase
VFLIGAVLLFALATAVGLPRAFTWLLSLSYEEATYARRAFATFVPLLAAALCGTLLYTLRGVARPPPDADLRRRVLALPARLAFVCVVGGEVLTAGATLHAHLVAATPLRVTLEVALCTGAAVALAAVPLYALARQVLLSLALLHATEGAPEGRPLSLRLQLGYTVFAVATAALVPATVLGLARLHAQGAAGASRRAAATAERLVASATELDPATATRLLSRAPLSGHERVILRLPSGSIVPEDALEEVSDLLYVERPLEGAFKGGALRVYYAPRLSSPWPLFVVTVLSLLFALAVASTLGAAVADDAQHIAHQITRVAEGEEPEPLPPVATADVRRVTMAVNRLLARIPRLTVESFLAVERAEEARRLKAQFLANMSHDLRSPLNSILGFSELLLRGLEGPIAPEQRTLLTSINATGLQLLRLLTEILDTAKVESGKMELHRQSTPAAEILTQAEREAVRGRDERAGEGLVISLTAGVAPVYVDPLRMAQATTHLLNYALDSSESGRVTLKVTDGELDESRVLIFDLSHDGVLSSEDASRLFDGFHRITGMKGLNLALPLSRSIIELHGGTIELVESEPATKNADANAETDKTPKTRLRAIIPVGVRRERWTPTRGVPRIR